ncbi:MAG: XdhC family protein [Myxococcota bacterium]
MRTNARDVWQQVADLVAAGRPVAVATVVRTRGSVPRRPPARMLVHPDGTTAGSVGGGEMEAQVIAEAIALLNGHETTKTLQYAFSDPKRGDVGVCGGEVEVMVEAIRPAPRVVVIGAGHVGREVVALAHWLEFDVTLTDDRPELCTPDAAPGADAYVVCDMSEVPERIRIDNATFVVLTTRSVHVDLGGLPTLLTTKPRYLGLIGSRRRWRVTAGRLREAGISDAAIATVTSPVGLELEAETPKEIAMSILSEIVMQLRGGTGRPMTKG